MRTCSILNCNKKHLAKGYCSTHYSNFKRTGDPLFKSNLWHNMFGTPEYRAWAHMLERCNNPKCNRYKSHGGRGITVCDEWKDFKIFYKEMGNKPKGKYSLDRINNNGNYESSNCRWATDSQQAVNKRVSKNNTSGYKGVYLYDNKWEVWIFLNKKRIYVGKYKDINDAINARKQAELKYYI